MSWLRRTWQRITRKREYPREIRADLPRETRLEIEECIQQLEHPNEGVRIAAARALGELRHPSAVPALSKAAQKGTGSGVEAEAMWALAKIDHPSAIPVLTQAIENTSRPYTGIEAAKALASMRHPGVIPALVKYGDYFPRQREFAQALFEISQELKGKQTDNPHAKALQLVGSYFHRGEDLGVIRKAYEAALKGKVTKENARLYVKELRALKGNVK